MYIFEFFTKGGLWMYPILVAQIISISIIIERCIALYGFRKANSSQKIKKFEEDIKKFKIDTILSKSDKIGNEVAGRLIKTGAQCLLNQSGKEEIQLKMEEVIHEESTRVDKRLGFLSLIANVATLLGLLGTIVGLIEAFSSLSFSNPSEKAKILSEGISVAMNTTAYGLVVAVPALIMFGILQSRANEILDDLNKTALKLYIWFGLNVTNIPKKSK